MYNLFVSSNENSWNGAPFQIEIGRCIREYTDPDITTRFGALDATAVSELKRLPCIFAYEAQNQKAPHFGIVRDVVRRKNDVRIQYEIQEVGAFLTADSLDAHSIELDISHWELNRTHWSVKDVNLPKELRALGLELPEWARGMSKAVDITKHRFDVALSFPGEERQLVDQIALELERKIGPNSYFYDNNYRAQLARPSLDVLLQDIYRNRSKLIVVFLGSNYQNKKWCGVEFRAIKDILLEREHGRIMFVRTDDGEVEGIFKTDGYIDSRKFSAKEIAEFIHQRVDLIA